MSKSINVNQGAQLPQKQNQNKSMLGFIQSMQPQIMKALPSAMTPERFTRICMTAISQNPQLAQCTTTSFAGAMMTAAQLGLEPNTPLGQAYLIPYKDYKKGVTECQFQLGYRGLIELAHRSGELQSIEAHVVYEGDEFEYELGLDPKLKHKPAMKDRGDITWVYAVYKLKSGGYGFEVMSVEDINKHRDKFSKAAGRGFSPWNDNWEAMAKKTVIKRVLKYAPLASDFVKGMTEDESVMDFKEVDSGEWDVVQKPYDEEQIVEAEVEIDGEKVDLETGEVK